MVKMFIIAFVFLESTHNSSPFFEVIDWLLLYLGLRLFLFLCCLNRKISLTFSFGLNIRWTNAGFEPFFIYFGEGGLKIFFNYEIGGLLSSFDMRNCLVFLKLLLIVLLYLHNLNYWRIDRLYFLKNALLIFFLFFFWR